MKNKFLKSIASVVAVVMLMSMVPAVVSAETATISNVNVEISKTENGKIVTVTADVTGLTEFTLLAVRDNAEYATLEDLPSDVVEEGAAMSDLEKQVEYIDQPEISGTALSYTFPLRDREGDLAMEAADCYINVFLGGAGASAVVAAAIEKLDAPAIAVEDPADKYYVEDENVVVTYEFANEEAEAIWEAKTLEVKIGDEVLEDPDWDFPGNNVKIPAASFDAASYTNAVITIAETENATFYPATAAAVTFTVASRVEEAKAAVVKSVEQVPNADDTAVTITIPANTEVAGVAIAYTIVSTEGFTDNGDGTITVTRPEAEADPIVIEFKATLTYGDLAIDPITFSTSVRPAGVAVDPANINFANFDGDVFVDVYGIDGARIIEIAKGDLDPSKDGLKLAGQAFFYSPVRGKYIGVVAGYTDADAVSAEIEVTAEAPVNVFYGTVDDPTHEYWLDGDGIQLADVMAALRMKNGQTAGLGLEVFISADVDQDGEILLSDVMHILQAKNGSRDSFDVEAN